eukprot:SAG31_NODE_21617_length_545_cov_0.919283_1_plen_39_part_01
MGRLRSEESIAQFGVAHGGDAGRTASSIRRRGPGPRIAA